MEFLPEDYKFNPSFPFDGIIEDGELINTVHQCYLEVDIENNIKCSNGVIIVRGKGGRERMVPLGLPALNSVNKYLTFRHFHDKSGVSPLKEESIEEPI